MAWQKPKKHKKNKNFIRYLLLKNKAGNIKKIIKKLMQFNIRKYELLGSRLKDQNSLSILMDEYKAWLAGAITSNQGNGRGIIWKIR